MRETINLKFTSCDWCDSGIEQGERCWVDDDGRSGNVCICSECGDREKEAQDEVITN